MSVLPPHSAATYASRVQTGSGQNGMGKGPDADASAAAPRAVAPTPAPSQTNAPAAAPPSSRVTLGTRPPAAVGYADPARATTEALDTAFSSVDFTAISPREIDDLVAAMRATGGADVGLMMMLETRGAAFRADLQSVVDGQGFTRDSAFDPEAPFDLLAATRDQIALADRFGSSSAFLSDQLAKLEAIHARTQVSPETSSPLKLGDAYRLWIE